LDENLDLIPAAKVNQGQKEQKDCKKKSGDGIKKIDLLLDSAIAKNVKKMNL
jgi:hypothetical protein